MDLSITSGTSAVKLKDENSMFSPLWKIIGVSDGTISSAYPSRSFKVLLARRPTFFVAALIVPTAALNSMTLFLLVTTANYDEKASSAVASVVAYFFIEIMYFDFSPVSSDSTPLLSFFFTFHAYLALAVCAAASKVIAYAESVEEEEKKIAAKIQNGDYNSEPPKKRKSPEFYNDL